MPQKKRRTNATRVDPSPADPTETDNAADQFEPFSMGQLAVTPGAAAAIEDAGINLMSLALRHLGGDWGRMAASDRKENNRSTRRGGSLHSTYVLPNGRTLWLITAPDRSHSTFMLPEER